MERRVHYQSLALFVFILSVWVSRTEGQTTIWTENFDGPVAPTMWINGGATPGSTIWTGSGCSTVPGMILPGPIAGPLTYTTPNYPEACGNDQCHNYWIINDAHTLHSSGRGSRSACTDHTPFPNTSPGMPHRSMHITYRPCALEADIGLFDDGPDYGDNFAFYKESGYPGLATNTDQWMYMNQSVNWGAIPPAQRCNMTLRFRTYLGGTTDGKMSRSVVYSIDGGVTWKVLVVDVAVPASTHTLTPPYFSSMGGSCNAWATCVVPLPAECNGVADLRFGFRWRNSNPPPYVNQYFNAGAFTIDDLSLTIPGGPTAGITATGSPFCSNQLIALSNTSNTNGVTPATYVWSFPTTGHSVANAASFTVGVVGGNTTYTTTSPTTIPQLYYSSQGVRALSLTVSTCIGSSTASVNITVGPCNPVPSMSRNVSQACLTAPTPPSGYPTSVILSGSDSQSLIPCTGGCVKWTWSFKNFAGATVVPTFLNGTNANSQNPEVRFSTADNYTAILTVQNNDNLTGVTVTQTNYFSFLQCDCTAPAAYVPCFSYGTGASGAFDAASLGGPGTYSLAGGTYNYTTFTIPSGYTINVTGPNPLIINATGAVTINGTLHANGGNGAVGTGGTASAGGGAGGNGSAGANGANGALGLNASAAGSGRGGVRVTFFGFTFGNGGGGGGNFTAGGAGRIQMGMAAAGGTSYGLATLPMLYGGSGGGGGGGGNPSRTGGGGGGGGGAIRITALSVAVNGTLSVNGGNGGLPNNTAADPSSGGGGGGSGGSIHIQTDVISGTGTISANGGNGAGGGAGSATGGGGGAGGVIYIQRGSSSFTGTISASPGLVAASSGSGGANGGAGSVQSVAAPIPGCGGGTPPPPVLCNSEFGSGVNGPFDASSLGGPGTYTLAGGTYNYTNFTIPSGYIINVTGTSPLVINATGTVTINGSLRANGGNGGNGVFGGAGAGGTAVGGGNAGGSGGYTGSHGAPGFNGMGTGGGGRGNISAAGGGGGYGGAGGLGGGSSVANSGTAGTTYGSAAAPTTGGSGGGGGSASGGFFATGAAGGGGGGGGGGAIRITASAIILGSTGQINVNGGAGGRGYSDCNFEYSAGGGGGSGGSVYLQAPTITLTPGYAIQANGGNGGGVAADCAFPGGGGGGGRVQVEYATLTGALTGITVNAGAAGTFNSGFFTVTSAAASGVSGSNGSLICVTSITPNADFASSNVWTGATNTDWHTASNWSAGVVPTASTDVLILANPVNPYPGGTPTNRMPKITTADGASRNVCNYGTITIGTAATPRKLTVAGTMNNYGAITSPNSNLTPDVEFTGTACIYRGGGVNFDADYGVANGASLQIRSGLSCRSFTMTGTGAMDVNALDLTLKRNFTSGTGTLTMPAGSRLVMDGPAPASWNNPYTGGDASLSTNPAIVDASPTQTISIGANTNFRNLIIRKQNVANVCTLANAHNHTIVDTLRIESGTLDALTNTLNGGAQLIMNSAQSKLMLAKVGGATLPELTGIYTLTNGQIELYNTTTGTVSQILRVPPAGSTAYFRLLFSNGVASSTMTRTLASSPIEVANEVEITSSGSSSVNTVDASTNRFWGAAALKMSNAGSNLRLARAGNSWANAVTLPEFTGPYTLTNGSVILYNTAGSANIYQYLYAPGSPYFNLILTNNPVTNTNIFRRLGGNVSANGSVLMSTPGTNCTHTVDAESNTFDGSATLAIYDNTLFRMSKSGVTLPEFTGAHSHFNNSTVEFYGTGTQTVKQNTSYRNMLFNHNGIRTIEPGTTTAALSVTINDGLVIVPGGTDQYNGTANLNMTGGELRIATLKTTATVPQFTGNYNLTAGTINLNGTGNQTLLALPKSGSTDYYNLTFSGNGVKDLAGNTDVENILALNLPTTTGNYVLTNGHAFTVLNDNVSAVTRSGGHVVGTLTRHIDNTASGVLKNYFFPVGSDNMGTPTYYEPLYMRIVLPFMTTTKVGCSFEKTAPAATWTPPLVETSINYTSLETEGFWKLNPDVAPVSSARYRVNVMPSAGWTFAGSNQALVKRTPTSMTSLNQWNWHGSTRIAAFHRDAYQEFSEFAIVSDDAVPLSIFDDSKLTATPIPPHTIRLDWTALNQTNNLGFEIERGLDAVTMQKIGFVEGDGNRRTPKAFLFNDHNIKLNTTYYYRFKQLDYDGKARISNVVSAMIAGTERDNSVVTLYPNPASNVAQFSFTLKKPGRVTLKIYDAMGKLIATPLAEMREAGTQFYEYSTTGLTNGVYYYRLEFNDTAVSAKLIIQK